MLLPAIPAGVSYSPGQRWLKRAPQIVYDNPLTSSDAWPPRRRWFRCPNHRFNGPWRGVRDLHSLQRLQAASENHQDLRHHHQGRSPGSELGALASSTGYGTGAMRLRDHPLLRTRSVSKILDEDNLAVTMQDGDDRRNQLWRYYELDIGEPLRHRPRWVHHRKPYGPVGRPDGDPRQDAAARQQGAWLLHKNLAKSTRRHTFGEEREVRKSAVATD